MNLTLAEFKLIISRYDHVIWDYDDTLSNTVLKKGDAYVQLFKDYPEKLRLFIKEDHLQNPGVSRFIKIPKYIKAASEFIDVDLKQDKFLEEFSKLCIDILIKQPLFKSFEKIIRYSDKLIKHHVLTNMPQIEIEKVLIYKNIYSKFKSVNGDQINKKLFLRKFLQTNSNKKIIFIGDSEGDLLAAKNNKIEFILKATKLV